MKKILTLGLILSTGTAFGAADKHEKSPIDPESKGTTEKAAKAVGRVVVGTANFIFQVPKAIYETIKDTASGGDVYYELDARNGDIDKRSFRLSVEAYAAGKARDNRGGLLPVKFTVAAEDGAGFTIEDAKISAITVAVKEFGISFDLLAIGHTKPTEYTSDAVGQFDYANLIDIKYNDVLWSHDKRDVDIIIGSRIAAGGVRNLKSHDQSCDIRGESFTYGGSAGVRFNDLNGGGSAVFEGFTKGMQFEKGHDVTRNGFQMVYKTPKKRFSFTLGVAEEKSSNFQTQDNQEVYLKAKYFFK